MSYLPRLLLLLTLALLTSKQSAACPKVGGLPDVTCDGEARIAILGDSVVFGVGDTTNNGKGGYVLRIAKKYPLATFDNLGVPGEQARRVIGTVESAFAGTGDTELAASLTKADVVILDIGRNDWWKFGPAKATWRDLKRIREMIQRKVASVTGHKPLVITAQIMGANRSGQGDWVIELNKLIAASSTPTAPADLKFNSLSKRLLLDRVHPGPVGYDRMAKILHQYLTTKLPKYVTAFREDGDKDGLYDEYESEKFGTSPLNSDTDGDGILDGNEERPA